MVLPLPIPAGPSMIADGRLFHVAMLVPDLEASMDLLGTAMNLVWTAIRERDFPAVIDGRELTIGTRNVFSRDGPPYVELITGADSAGRDLPGTAGTLFEAGPGGRFHHAGIYVEDVGAEAERLQRLGMTALGFAKGNKPGRYVGAFLSNPQGFHLELVHISLKARIEENVAAGI